MDDQTDRQAAVGEMGGRRRRQVAVCAHPAVVHHCDVSVGAGKVLEGSRAARVARKRRRQIAAWNLDGRLPQTEPHAADARRSRRLAAPTAVRTTRCAQAPDGLACPRPVPPPP